MLRKVFAPSFLVVIGGGLVVLGAWSNTYLNRSQQTAAAGSANELAGAHFATIEPEPLQDPPGTISVGPPPVIATIESDPPSDPPGVLPGGPAGAQRRPAKTMAPVDPPANP
jgi:hypothetical protein